MDSLPTRRQELCWHHIFVLFTHIILLLSLLLFLLILLPLLPPGADAIKSTFSELLKIKDQQNRALS